MKNYLYIYSLLGHAEAVSNHAMQWMWEVCIPLHTGNLFSLNFHWEFEVKAFWVMPKQCQSML